MDSIWPWFRATRAKPWLGGLGHQAPGWRQSHDKQPVTCCYSTFNTVLFLWYLCAGDNFTPLPFGVLGHLRRLGHVSALSIKPWLKRRIWTFSSPHNRTNTFRSKDRILDHGYIIFLGNTELLPQTLKTSVSISVSTVYFLNWGTEHSRCL